MSLAARLGAAFGSMGAGALLGVFALSRSSVPGAMGLPPGAGSALLLALLAVCAGVGMLTAAGAPEGRFFSCAGAHAALGLGLFLCGCAFATMGFYYGGPCIAAVLFAVGLPVFALGVHLTRRAWREPA